MLDGRRGLPTPCHCLGYGATANIWQESFLFRSRHQKLPYKQIADSLHKSELACRLHYHHMTVGRKGHRADEPDDEMVEDNIGSSPSTVQSEQVSPPLNQSEASPSRIRTPSISPHVGSSSKVCTLPSFDTFLQTTFQSDSSHKRCYSMPQALPLTLSPNAASKEIVSQLNGARSSRTLSGTWLRNHRTSPTTSWIGPRSGKETAQSELQLFASPDQLSPDEGLRPSPGPYV